MAKNFPFFKFIATEWMTGDIVFESLSTQGLFINICALYWQRNGELTIDDINKRFKNPEELKDLTDRFISITEGLISINFLDEQLIDASHISKVNSENGSKGGRPKKPIANPSLTEGLTDKSEPKPKKSKEEKEREEEEEINKRKKEFNDRKLKFATTLESNVSKYGRDLLNDFYKYWTEPNQTGTKFRKEMEKTWDLDRRLENWAKRDKNFTKIQDGTTKQTPTKKRPVFDSESAFKTLAGKSQGRFSED